MKTHVLYLGSNIFGLFVEGHGPLPVCVSGSDGKLFELAKKLEKGGKKDDQCHHS